MCNERGHDQAFMVDSAKLIEGKTVYYKYCTFILGSIGLGKTVLCGEYLNDRDLPSDMIPVSGTKIEY